jgi:hypothetical protein
MTTPVNDFLLVPMQLDVMRLNQQDAAATPFFRFQMDYSLLDFFEPPEPPPFDANSYGQPGVGMYLHWTLPQGLRQGTRAADDTQFKLVPNRWLITRLQSNPGGAPTVKAWVVESDTQVTGPNVGSPYYNGAPIRIGKVTVCTPTMGPLTPQSAPFITAVAPGSATFAAYSPGVQNVFSFLDDVTDNNGNPIAEATFSYTVVGWYSSATSDPLSDLHYAWAANSNANLPNSFVLQTVPASGSDHTPQLLFDWFVFAPSAADLPRRMLLHALVSGVVWNANTDSAPVPNFPENLASTVKVAIGNTAVDALAAIVVANGGSQTDADLLQAFQYGQIDVFDQPGSAAILNQTIRSHWFGASVGGTLWTIVSPGTDDSSSSAAPLTPPQQQALATYNTTQAESDRQQRLLESMQTALYDLWWKYNYGSQNGVPSSTWTWDQLQPQFLMHLGLDPNHPASTCSTAPNPQLLFCQVTAQQQLLAQLQTQLQTQASTLEGLLDPATQVLKAVKLPPFHTASDPVLVISGLGRATNFDPASSVLCRLPAQMLSSLAVNGTIYSAGGTGKDITANLPVLNVPAGILPDAVLAFLTESFFLSPWMFAATILGDTNPCPVEGSTPPPPTDPLLNAVVAAIQAASPTTKANWTPPAPAFGPLAYAASQWTQPWIPLLLDWQITVLEAPAYDPGPVGGSYSFTRNDWSFNGTDFVWCGPKGTTPPNFDDTNQQMQLSGRTFITPHLSLNLADQLETYIQNHAQRYPDLTTELEDLEKQLQDIQQQDLLSQRLGGMLNGMIERSHTSVPAPDANTLKLVGNLQHGHPSPWPNAKGNELPQVWDFAPMCGTFFVFNKLQVTDTFGRSIDLMQANGSTWPHNDQTPEDLYFYPIIAPAMQPDGFPQGSGESTSATQRMIKLAPRMIQDARVTLTLLSNDGNDLNIYQSPGANPVCGWLIANHLNRSLAVYSADGTAFGELYLSLRAGNTYTPVWQPDPTNPNAPTHVSDIPNPFLSAMLSELVTLATVDNGASFAGFLASIDATLWTIDPLGQRKDQDLSVLVGRPLAVVRAQATLNLRGTPCTMQDWDTIFNLPGDNGISTLAEENGGVFTPQWPVMLGSQALRNDGLIGYFADAASHGNWSTFNAVNIPTDGPSTSYLQQISPTNSPQLSFVDDTITSPSIAANQLSRLTLLVDPRGSVHAFTGLLPVASLQVPPQFVTAPLKTMSYLFRAGPFLTSPNAVRIPRPAERQGAWAWYDNVIQTTTPLQQADANVRLSTIPPLIKEGWLKFTPSPAATPQKNAKLANPAKEKISR